MDKPQIIEHASKSLTSTVYDTRWLPGTARFAVVGASPRGTGVLQVYQLEHGKCTLVREATKQHSFKCATFEAALVASHMATGDFVGNLHVWDTASLDAPLYTAKAHSEIINCVAGVGGQGVGAGAPELATGSRDGCVRVWDVRQKDAPVASLEPGQGQQRRDCWTVAFGNAHNASERMLVAGYDNGDVKILDLRMNSLVWETNVGNGVCGAEFDRRDIQANKLAVTTLGNNFIVYDMRTYNEKHGGYASVTTEAHKSTVWLARHLPQNRDVWMTAGGNGALALWKYTYPSQRSRTLTDSKEVVGVPGTVTEIRQAPMAPQPISSFDWHRDKQGLCVFGSFFIHLVLRSSAAKNDNRPARARDRSPPSPAVPRRGPRRIRTPHGRPGGHAISRGQTLRPRRLLASHGGHPGTLGAPRFRGR